MSITFGLIASVLLSLVIGAAAYNPCYAIIDNNTYYETPCYKTLFTDHNGFEIRSYSVGAANLVAYNISADVTVYQEALEMDGYYVLGYFAGYNNEQNESLTNARTVPLSLSVPVPGVRGNWLGFMALAPSKWPVGSQPPAPSNGVELLPLAENAPALLASLHVQLQNGSPQPSDFDALCQTLLGKVDALSGWKVNKQSPFSPTHSRYYTQNFFGPMFDIECWVAVMKA